MIPAWTCRNGLELTSWQEPAEIGFQYAGQRLSGIFRAEEVKLLSLFAGSGGGSKAGKIEKA